MRSFYTLIPALALLLAASAATAQQQQGGGGDWNNPSSQQQDQVKQTRDNVVSGLNNIGQQESGTDTSNIADQINSTTQSTIDQGSQMLNNLTR